MERLSPSQIVEICKSFGVELLAAADGTGRMRGRVDRLPEQLLKVVRRWRRDAVVSHLLSGLPRQKQFLWRSGHVFTTSPDTPDGIPSGALWWRWQGESGWRPIEGACHVAGVGAGSVRLAHCLPPGEHLEGQVPGARRPDSESGNLAGGQRVAGHPMLFPVGGLHAAGDPTRGGAENG